MRTLNLLPPTIVLLLTASALSADTERLFTELDRNRDGQLDVQEIKTDHKRLFERLLRTADGDHDGKLSSIEFQTGLQPHAPAKPMVEKEGSELPGTDALLLLLAKMDTNANGTIEAAEVPEPLQPIFDRIEERLGGKPDGVLDRRELTQAAPRLSQIAMRFAERTKLDVEVELALLPKKQWQSVQNMLGPRPRGEYLANPEQAREFFRRLDANGDGQIIAEEVPDALAERFEQLLQRADRNRNDQLSEAEVLKFSRQLQVFSENRLSPAELRTEIQRLLKQLDRNGDQQISRQEAPRRLKARFDRVDTDGSGQIERDELAPVVQLLSRLRQPESSPAAKADSKMQPVD